MTCRGFIQFLLKVINFLFVLIGLTMVGYGIYMFVVWNNSSSSSSTTSSPPPPPPPDEISLRYQSPPDLSFNVFDRNNAVNGLQLRRALLQEDSELNINNLSSFWSLVPTAWFLCVFIAVGVVITLITCSGYIAAATTNGCCLSCYSFFLGILIVVELALGAFIYFDDDWKEVIPSDSTGELETIEDFIQDKIVIFRWVALGVLILQAFALLLSVVLRALGGNRERGYDSDDEFVALRNRQPLLNRQTTGTASSTATENRPARTDAWSTRMKEKYGLDTKEFSYNPTQQAATTEVKKGWCTIM